MAERERRQRDTDIGTGSDDEVVADVATSSRAAEHGERLKHVLDDLLDEIDEVLETNAEEFVKSYIQKGGE